MNRPFLATLVLVATAGLVAVSGSRAAEAPITLSATGTATVDGIDEPGEWDTAAQVDFTVGTPGFQPWVGDAPIPATLLVMNDSRNLYLAVRVARQSIVDATENVGSGVYVRFDNNRDVLTLSQTNGFHDAQFQEPCYSHFLCTAWDEQLGGTLDGAGAMTTTSGNTFFELSHALNSADDLHDFGLVPGDHTQPWVILFLCAENPCRSFISYCTDGCASASPPATDIVVAAPDLASPETIVNGPAEGSISDQSAATFTLSGQDDVTGARGLRFSCSVDYGPVEACASTFQVGPLADGAHLLTVRARDRAGNEDPTPEVRSWTVDTTAPDTTLTGGPVRLTPSRSASIPFAATDNLSAAIALRFECMLDGAAFAPCGSPYTVDSLADGSHEFAVRAYDQAGNREVSPALHTWTVDATPPSKPRIRGPRETTKRRPLFRVSSTDALTPPGELVLVCALDVQRPRPCTTRYRPTLRIGKHVLRVAAVDGAGNRSLVARFSVVRKPKS